MPEVSTICRAIRQTVMSLPRWTPLARIAAEPASGGALPRHRRRPGADRRAARRTLACRRRRARSCSASARRYALVACVTGRPSEVAREIVGVDGLTYVGEHGLELDPTAQEWAERIHGVRGRGAVAGVEAKPLSVAFHYRGAADPEAARERARAVAAAALRSRLQDAVGADGARGAAARRRVEGDRRAPPAARRPACSGRCMQATTRPTSTASPPSTGSRPPCASRSSRPKARPSSASAPI